MNQTLYGLREAGLTIAYTLIVRARALVRGIRRPTEMGVRALVYHGPQILLVRHRAGRQPWSLPGGGIERYETLDRATEREVREEAGCRVEIGHMLGLYHAFAEGMSNYTAVFVCRALSAAQAPVGDLEIVDARFFAPHDLPAGTESGSLRRIQEYQQGEQAVYRSW